MSNGAIAEGARWKGQTCLAHLQGDSLLAVEAEVKAEEHEEEVVVVVVVVVVAIIAAAANCCNVVASLADQDFIIC